MQRLYDTDFAVDDDYMRTARWNWHPGVEEPEAAADYALDGTARSSFRNGKHRTTDRNGFDCLTGADWLSEWWQMHLRSRA
ncbi:hypothetical protein ACJ41P_10345 [Azospirillum argentinense]|uniref:Uncharacterized protein n=1 Tax=Azospirillum argentinense TaxID=2970906 RepID=A0ABW8V4U4_9PROT